MDPWDSIFTPTESVQPAAEPQGEDPWAAIFASTAPPAPAAVEPSAAPAPVAQKPADNLQGFAGKPLSVEGALEGGYVKDFLAHLRERADKFPVDSPERDELSKRIAGLQVDLGEFDRQKSESKKLGISRDTLVRGESPVGAAEGSIAKQAVGQTLLRAEQSLSNIAETGISLTDRAIGSGKVSAKIHKDKALRDEFLGAVEAGGDVEKYLGKTGSRIYNGAVGSIAKFATIGTVAGPTAVYSMIAGEAYDDGLEEAKNNGMTGIKANAYAGAKATIEAGVSALFGKVAGKQGIKLMETMFSPGVRKVVAATADKALKGTRGKLANELAGVGVETIEELVTDVAVQGVELTAGVSKGYDLGRTLEAAAGGAVGRSATGVGQAYAGAGKDLNDAVKKIHPQLIEESFKGAIAADNIDPVKAQAALDAGNRQEFEAALGIKNTSETFRESFKIATEANQEAEAVAQGKPPAVSGKHFDENFNYKKAPKTVQEGSGELRAEQADELVNRADAPAWLKGHNKYELIDTIGELQRGDPGLPKLGDDFSMLEKLALTKYKHEGYTSINPKLRSGENKERMASFRQTLDGALAKLPKYEGTVYRSRRPGDPQNTKRLEAERASLKPGAIITDDGYLSTSRTYEGTKDFRGKDRIEYEIQGTTSGVDFRQVNEGDQEVLFPPGAKFEVVSVEHPSKNVTKAVLREVTPGTPETVATSEATITKAPEAPAPPPVIAPKPTAPEAVSPAPSTTMDPRTYTVLRTELAKPRGFVQESIIGTKGKLTPSESKAISGYVNNDFAKINDSLRGKIKMSPQTKTKIAELSRALEKMPTYDGWTRRDIRARAGTPDGDSLRNLKPGDTFSDKAFMSTTADTYAGVTDDSIPDPKNTITYFIKGKNGKVLQNPGSMVNEVEVLFKPDTKFVVDRVAESDRGGIEVFMREEGVEPQANISGEQFIEYVGQSLPQGVDRFTTMARGMGPDVARAWEKKNKMPADWHQHVLQNLREGKGLPKERWANWAPMLDKVYDEAMSAGITEPELAAMLEQNFPVTMIENLAFSLEHIAPRTVEDAQEDDVTGPPEPPQTPDGPPEQPPGPPPEGAAPVPQGPKEGVSTIKKELQAMMKDLGAPTVYSPARQRQLDAMEQAVAQGLPAQAVDFAAGLVAEPRPITDVERGGLLVAIAQRKRQYRDLSRAMSEGGGDPATTAATMSRIRSEAELLVAGSMMSGSETARALAMHKFRIDDDMDTDAIIGRMRVAKGAPLTEQERTKVADDVAAYEAKNAESKAANDKINNDIADKVIQGAAQPASDIDGLYKRMGELLSEGCATE